MKNEDLIQENVRLKQKLMDYQKYIEEIIPLDAIEIDTITKSKRKFTLRRNSQKQMRLSFNNGGTIDEFQMNRLYVFLGKHLGLEPIHS